MVETGKTPFTDSLKRDTRGDLSTNEADPILRARVGTNKVRAREGHEDENAIFAGIDAIVRGLQAEVAPLIAEVDQRETALDAGEDIDLESIEQINTQIAKLTFDAVDQMNRLLEEHDFGDSPTKERATIFLAATTASRDALRDERQVHIDTKHSDNPPTDEEVADLFERIATFAELLPGEFERAFES